MTAPTSNVPQFASALAVDGDWQQCVDSAVAEVHSRLSGGANVAFAFISAQLGRHADAIAARLVEQLGTELVIGCTAESLLGVGREVEFEPGISLLAGVLPAATLTPMHLMFERTPDGGSIVGWPDELIEAWPDDAALIVLGDPYTFPADLLLERLNVDRPGVPVVGGMASGAARPGDSRLILGRNSLAEGAVAVLIHGIKSHTVVSQGCRPIGRHFVITKAERNVIQELGGKPALSQLKDVFESLPNREQAMVQESLHLGRVVSEYQDTFGQGDFLVRNVMGVDQQSGAIVVGDYMRPGQTVQFHVRDAETADDEMRQLLAQLKSQPDIAPAGALLFTCNGRGTRLFPKPHHDAELVRDAFGELPIAGFFAQGELGPVSGENFVHGFTASLVIFQ